MSHAPKTVLVMVGNIKSADQFKKLCLCMNPVFRKILDEDAVVIYSLWNPEYTFVMGPKESMFITRPFVAVTGLNFGKRADYELHDKLLIQSELQKAAGITVIMG